MSDEHEEHKPFRWRSDELLALAVPLVVLAVAVVATLAFGFAGLIATFLVLVLVAFVMLTLLSRG